MNHKVTLGAVLAQVGGLRIRAIEKPIKNEIYGIYAGKKLYRAFTNLEVAKKEALRAQSNKPSHYPSRKAFLAWKNSL